MHFESYPGDRIEWILKEAQTWLQEDHFIDLSITCGEADGMRFKCHKIMFHQFLKQFLSLEHIEEVEEVEEETKVEKEVEKVTFDEVMWAICRWRLSVQWKRYMVMRAVKWIRHGEGNFYILGW